MSQMMNKYETEVQDSKISGELIKVVTCLLKSCAEYRGRALKRTFYE